MKNLWIPFLAYFAVIGLASAFGHGHVATAASVRQPVAYRATPMAAKAQGHLGLTGVGSTSFRPTVLSNCSLWLDDADLSTLWTTSGMSTQVSANNDPVGRWLDKSGNGHDVDQKQISAPDLRPTYLTGQQNGYGGVYFNFDVGTGAAGRQIMQFVSSFTSAAPWTIFAVMNYAHVGGINQTFLTGDPATQCAIARFNTDDTPHMIKGGVADFSSGSTAIPAGSASVTIWQYNGTTPYFSINGPASSVTTTSTPALSGNWLYFGSDQLTFNSTMKAKVFEVIVYSRSLSSGERIRVLRYLNAKWALGLTTTTFAMTTPLARNNYAYAQ